MLQIQIHISDFSVETRGGGHVKGMGICIF